MGLDLWGQGEERDRAGSAEGEGDAGARSRTTRRDDEEGEGRRTKAPRAPRGILVMFLRTKSASARDFVPCFVWAGGGEREGEMREREERGTGVEKKREVVRSVSMPLKIVIRSPHSLSLWLTSVHDRRTSDRRVPVSMSFGL